MAVEISPQDESHFGEGRLFLTDARLVFAVLNYFRRVVVRRMFGVSDEGANVFTFILAVLAAEGTYQAVHRVVHAPRPSGVDLAIGGALVRESALAVAGARARDFPFFGALVTLAMFGAPVLAGVRWASQSLRRSERRVRARRLARYREVLRKARDEGLRRAAQPHLADQ